MALPTAVLGQFAAEASEIFAGTTSDIWLVEGEILIPAVPSYFPTHGISLNGIPATATAMSQRFYGGVDSNGVAQVTRLDFSANPANNDTITIDSIVFTFKTSAGASPDIQIGANALATANSTVTIVNANLSVGATGVVTDTTPTAPQITFTAEVAGVAFTTAESGTATAWTVVTANTSDTSGVQAQVTVKFVGTRTKAGTVNQVVIPMVIGTTNPKVERVRFQYDTAADSTTASQIATGLHDVITKARDNTAITSGTGKRYFSTNLLNTNTEIAAAMVNLFGVSGDNNITVSTDTITIKCKEKNDAGNFLAVGTEVLVSAPSPLISVSTDGVPQVPGIPIHLGYQDAFQAAISPQTQDVTASNSKLRVTQIVTGQTLDISFKLFQDNNLSEFAKLGLNSAASTYTDGSNVVLFAGLPLPAKFGLVFVSPSKLVAGDYDVIVLYSVQAQALTINRSRGTVSGFDIKFSPNAFNRQGDPVGYIRQPRQLV